MKAVRVALWALVADVASVVVFVAIGRRNHDETTGASGVFSTAAPFLLALAVTWALGRVWREPIGTGAGVSTWIGTVAIGMVLRNLLFDDGTATAFIIVATIFLGIVLNGWRSIARRVRVRGDS
ncbi:MAG: hypothetical protein RL391_329 [Actinomycetota bacterium]